METVTAIVQREPEECWRVFTDAASLPTWVPGLRRAQILTIDRGMPSEIHFEFAGSLAYTLVYSYDRDHREVHWQPKLGKDEGVTGFVRFEPVEGGTRVTYGLEHGDGRGATERALGDAKPLIEAFAARMTL